jgi:type I restriction enzyme S subunit
MQKVKIDDVLKYEQPTKYIVESQNYSNDFKTPVLTAGKSFILGYTDEENGVFNDFPVIIFDDFTTAFHYVDFPFKVKSSAMKILKTVKEKADLKYLFYRMQTISIDKDLHKRYWISKYSQIQISLPPLPTQQKIAIILDKADELRQYNKQLIEKYDALMLSLFLDMFGDPVKNEKGWEIKKMNEFINSLVDVGSNGANDWVSKNIQMKDSEDYALMIRTTNLSKNDFEKNLKFVTKYTYDLFKKTKVFGGEIIMNKIGSAGDFWIMPNLNRPVSLGLNQLMMTFNNLDKIFFFFYYSTEYGKKLIKSKLNGATTKSITKTALRELEILYPPMSLQNQFAERVQLIETQKQQAQEALAKSEELFQSLLQRAFNGELV